MKTIKQLFNKLFNNEQTRQRKQKTRVSIIFVCTGGWHACRYRGMRFLCMRTSMGTTATTEDSAILRSNWEAEYLECLPRQWIQS